MMVELLNYRNVALPGVYAILNRNSRKVDVRFATNCLSAIVSHLSQIWDGTHDCKEFIADQNEISFELLETCKDPEQRMLLQSYYLLEYEKKGYAFYRKRPALRYKVTTEVQRRNTEVHVKLVNDAHSEKVVGVFRSMSQAEAFIRQYYEPQGVILFPGDGASKSTPHMRTYREVIFPVYSLSKETKRYLSGRVGG